MKHFFKNIWVWSFFFYLTCSQTSQTALKHKIMYFMWQPFLMLPRFSCVQERSVILEYPGSDMVCIYPNPSISLQLKEDRDRGLPVIWIAKCCHQSFSKLLLIPMSEPYRSNRLHNFNSQRSHKMNHMIKRCNNTFHWKIWLNFDLGKLILQMFLIWAHQQRKELEEYHPWWMYSDYTRYIL